MNARQIALQALEAEGIPDNGAAEVITDMLRELDMLREGAAPKVSRDALIGMAVFDSITAMMTDSTGKHIRAVPEGLDPQWWPTVLAVDTTIKVLTGDFARQVADPDKIRKVIHRVLPIVVESSAASERPETRYRTHRDGERHADVITNAMVAYIRGETEEQGENNARHAD